MGSEVEYVNSNTVRRRRSDSPESLDHGTAYMIRMPSTYSYYEYCECCCNTMSFTEKFTVQAPSIHVTARFVVDDE